jgi:hypothetical protein
MKGGSPRVGASAPGQRGPFGLRPYSLVPEPGEPPSPWPTLADWLAGATDAHPLWAWERHQDEAGVHLDALERLINAVDTAVRPGPAARRRGKIRDFAALNNHAQLLDLRAELAVGAALSAAGLRPALGDTSRPNPDYLVSLPSGAAAGIEVTAPSPPGMSALCVRIVHEVLGPGSTVDATLSFSRYPSRLRQPAVERVVAAVRTLAAGSPDSGTTTVELPYDLPNGDADLEPVAVRVQLAPGEGSADWEVSAGELAQPMDSATFAAFAAGSTPAKSAQGRSLDGEPVLLAADMSRYGAAWMRPAPVWAVMLARSEHFTPAYPFAGLVVFRQSLTVPAVLDPGVGINPHAPASTRAQVEELCTVLGWPFA